MKMNEDPQAILEKAQQLLDTMLGYLGFVVQVEPDTNTKGLGLQIFTEEAETLIGSKGDRLEDIQYLLNRLVHKYFPDGPRIRVDIEHHRTMQEDALVQRVQEHANKVRHTGRAIKLWPMNSYQRRLIHNAFKDDPLVQSWSPNDSAKLKRITLMRRKAASADGKA